MCFVKMAHFTILFSQKAGLLRRCWKLKKEVKLRCWNWRTFISEYKASVHYRCLQRELTVLAEISACAAGSFYVGFIIQQPDIRVERIKDIKLFSIGIGLTIVHALQVGALIKQVILKQDGFPDTHIALTG